MNRVEILKIIIYNKIYSMRLRRKKMKQHESLGFLKKNRSNIITAHLGPSQILVVGFLVLILIASLLLMLPLSSNEGTSTPFIDALFTATSAVCVTGLVVVNTLAHWSVFGKVIILFCIQIGGLGFMTLVSMLFIILGRRITLRNRLIMQEALNFNTTAGIVKFTRYIVIGTFLVEGIGALLLSFAFIPEYGFGKGIIYGIFHSISAFCNAGFDIVGDSSLTPYVGNTLINFTIMSLIIISGLGFTVWIDTYNAIHAKIKEGCKWQQAFHKMSLHSRLVWIITIILLIGGFIFFFFAEMSNPATFGNLLLKEKLYAAMFQSVTTRTAGFNTLPLAAMTDGSKLMTIILMFIGGSPAGTAGGIKTVTVGVIILCALSTLKGEDETVIFKRRIPRQIIRRSITIVMIAGCVITVMLMILSFSESFSLMEILYEVVSASATVGITLGITSRLSLIGKIVIIIAMFIGRLGPITIAVALMIKQDKNKAIIEYPEEKVMVG